MAVGAAIVWGTSWVATGLVLRDFGADAVAAWRGVGSFVLVLGLLLVPIARSERLATEDDAAAASPGRGRLLRYGVLAVLGGPWFVLGMTLAVELTGATISAFVAGLYPVVAAVAAPLLLPERPSPAAALGLLMAFAGILLLAGFDPVGLDMLGLLIGLTVAVFLGLFLLLVRRWSAGWGLSALRITAANFGVLSLVALPVAFHNDPAGLLPPAGLPVWLAMAWLVLGPGVLANLFVLGSVRRLPAHESSAYLMLSPLAAALLAAWLLDERLVPVQALGAALVLAGIGAATIPVGRIVGRLRYGGAESR